jgi:quercetin dioxygenase-like cupin family protein
MSGFGELDKVAPEQINDKISRRVVAGKQGMMVWWSIKAGAHAAAHHHPHEQIVWIIEGEVDFHVGDETVRLGPGGLVVVPPNVTHYAEVVGDKPALNLDVFTPARPEYGG